MKKISFLFFTGLLLLNSQLLMSQTALNISENANSGSYVPLEDFFRNPQKSSFQLSPDGTKLSYLAPFENRMNLFVQPVNGGPATKVTNVTDRDISGYLWGNNNVLIYLKDVGGDENYALFAVSPDGGKSRDLTNFKGVRTELIDELENDEDHILISMNKRDATVFDVYKLNVNSGQFEMVAKNPGNISGWIADHNGVVRVATTTDGVNTSLLYRKDEKAKWQTIITTNFREGISPLFFDFENKDLYCSSNIQRDKSAIVKFDLEKKKESEVLFEHPMVDVENLNYSHKRKVLTSISYTVDKRERHFLDSDTRQLFEYLKNELPDKEITITSTDKDEKNYIVRTSSDRTMGAYYIFTPEIKQLTLIEEISPWLNENAMATMRPIEYKTRDGLLIHGYLTLPSNGQTTNLPLVVNPHGGPWARDTWGFNPEVQFLANRGYAVLQMNFRGSTGYGRRFWEMSFKEWGKKMQDDISDGVSYMINTGVADKERIAIYGGSYGGYATLAGLTFTPKLYRCGIDYVGVSNLFTFMKTIPPYWKPYLEMMYTMVGNPEEDKALLEAASPVMHANNIVAPLFIAQGAKDPRVNKAESDQMVEALRARGIEVEYMVEEEEGHGFHNEENRFKFYKAMEAFLAIHLGQQ
jgi:dipeptidyl aminopeptidase/acylaminoacyl peptidase